MTSRKNINIWPSLIAFLSLQSVSMCVCARVRMRVRDHVNSSGSMVDEVRSPEKIIVFLKSCLMFCENYGVSRKL